MIRCNFAGFALFKLAAPTGESIIRVMINQIPA